jgi:hypothetical protein
VIFPYTYAIYFDQMHHLHYIPLTSHLSSLLFYQTVFNFMLSSYVCVCAHVLVCILITYTPLPSLFSLPPSLILPSDSHHLYFHHYCCYYFRSRFFLSKNMWYWPCEFSISCSTWDLWSELLSLTPLLEQAFSCSWLLQKLIGRCRKDTG